jgi:titin
MPPATAVAAAEESGSRALTTLAIASLSSTENLITWDSGANNGRGFRLERSLDGTTDWRSIATVEAGTTNYIDGGLRPDTLYYYRFRTSQTDISDVVSARTEPLVETETGEPKPAEAILTAPTSLRAISNTPGQLTLTWEDISNNEAGFAIERSLDGVTFTAIEITTPGTTAFVERDLDPAIYFYRLRSVSGDNYSSYSDIVSVTVRGMLVESDTDEVVSQPNLSSTPEQPANTASIGQRWLITLAATLFVALVGVILLLVRAKQHPL